MLAKKPVPVSTRQDKAKLPNAFQSNQAQHGHPIIYRHTTIHFFNYYTFLQNPKGMI